MNDLHGILAATFPVVRVPKKVSSMTVESPKDEMGLGKTIQSIALLLYLKELHEPAF